MMAASVASSRDLSSRDMAVLLGHFLCRYTESTVVSYTLGRRPKSFCNVSYYFCMCHLKLLQCFLVP